MHTTVFKLVYIDIDILYVSANQAAIFRGIKYEGWIH
jgi:hypothetical protein